MNEIILPTSKTIDLTDYIFRHSFIPNNKVIYDLKFSINHNGTIGNGGNYTVMLMDNSNDIKEIGDQIGVQDIGSYSSLLDVMKPMTASMIMLYLC